MKIKCQHRRHEDLLDFPCYGLVGKWILQADSDKVEHARYCSWSKKGPEAPIREGLPGTASHRVPDELGRMMKT